MQKILLIEDDLLDQKAILRCVNSKSLPYEITIANSVKKGIKYLSEGDDFDLILLDYKLPDGTGIDIIKELDIYPPIIFITGKGNEEIAVEAMKLGAYDYIVKDVDGNYLAILPTRIDMVLDRVQKDKELQILQSLLPICASCKRIRNKQDQWEEIETFIKKHSNKDVRISHGICDICTLKLYPEED